MNKECENCIKRKTMWCPPSCECMALDELPYHLDKTLALQKIDNLQQENKQLKEEKPYLYTNTEWEDILEYQGKSYIELDRYKKREKEIMDKYFHQSKYASEMEDKYITVNSILTELEQYYKEQLEFIVELPVYTKDIAQEHKVMELCYEDFLNKIQELKEKYK